jgi:hypothetical protein
VEDQVRELQVDLEFYLEEQEILRQLVRLKVLRVVVDQHVLIMEVEVEVGLLQ